MTMPQNFDCVDKEEPGTKNDENISEQFDDGTDDYINTAGCGSDEMVGDDTEYVLPTSLLFLRDIIENKRISPYLNDLL